MTRGFLAGSIFGVLTAGVSAAALSVAIGFPDKDAAAPLQTMDASAVKPAAPDAQAVAAADTSDAVAPDARDLAKADAAPPAVETAEPDVAPAPEIAKAAEPDTSDAPAPEVTVADATDAAPKPAAKGTPAEPIVVAAREPVEPGRRPAPEVDFDTPLAPNADLDAPDDPDAVDADTDPLALPVVGRTPAAPDAQDADVTAPGARIAVSSDAPVLPGAQSAAPGAPAREAQPDISTLPAQPPVPAFPEGPSALVADADVPASDSKPVEDAIVAAADPGADAGARVASDIILEASDAPDPLAVVKADPKVDPDSDVVVAAEDPAAKAADDQNAPVITAAVADPEQEAPDGPVTKDLAATPLAEPVAPVAQETDLADATDLDDPDPAPDTTVIASAETRDLPTISFDRNAGDAPETAALANPDTALQSPDTVQASDNDGVAVPPPGRPSIGKPAGSLLNRDPAVPVGRLPSVGGGGAQTATSGLGPDSAVIRFAAQAVVADEVPRLSILLIDDGSGPLGPDTLEAFPFPVTFVLTTGHPDPAGAATAYRDMGFEVAVQADVPAGAAATDVEVTLTAALDQVGQSVAVIEGPSGGLRDSSAAATQAASVLSSTGHGLVLMPKGLNTAQSLVARAGVPSATVFRDFDGEGQDASIIRRSLDQAAFRARQEGAVIMIGRLRADTISALLLWGLQDRGTSIAFAPVSLVLRESVEP